MLAVERKNSILGLLQSDGRVVVSELAEKFDVSEETIRRDPANWLWSHNRWKRTHKEFDELFEVVNGKVMKKENLHGNA